MVQFNINIMTHYLNALDRKTFLPFFQAKYFLLFSVVIYCILNMPIYIFMFLKFLDFKKKT